MHEVTLKLRQIKHGILAAGKVDGPELESLRREIYAHDKIGRRRPTSSSSCTNRCSIARRPSSISSTRPSRTTSSHMAGSTPRRPPGCGRCSPPTPRSLTASAVFA